MLSHQGQLEKCLVCSLGCFLLLFLVSQPSVKYKHTKHVVWRSQVEHQDKFIFLGAVSSVFLFPLRPGTTWDLQLLLQGPQNMDNSKAAQGVPMGLLSPHLTMGLHNQPIVLASSSEVSVGSPQTGGKIR